MKRIISLPILFLLQLIPISLYAANIDRQAFDPNDGFALISSAEELRLSWEIAGREAFIDFQFIPRQGNTPAAPLIKSLGIDSSTIMEGLDPNYLFWVGDRDLELRDGWEIFFDRVPTRPYSVEKGYLVPGEVTVSTKEGRATVEIDGLNSENFSGSKCPNSVL